MSRYRIDGALMGKMKSKSARPTIKEVAKLARVCIMTVSRVLNQHPSVRRSTQKKVEWAISQLGYEQNEAARLMKGQRARLIGLIVPDLSDTFFATCAHVVQHIARQHGFMTLVVGSERDAALEIQQADLMAKRMISGLLLVSSLVDGGERLAHLMVTGLPVVAFDRPVPHLKTDAVVVENRSGAEEAVKHLQQHGHKRIACIGYDKDVYTIRERVEGYKSVMHNLRLKPQLQLDLHTTEEVRQWMEATVASDAMPTAIFCLNHRTSINLLLALGELKITVPDQVAVIGFDDFPLASVLNPPLTTVSQSAGDVARRAMDLLLTRIKEPSGEPPEGGAKMMLPVQLIIRGSCGVHPTDRLRKPHRPIKAE